MTPSDALNQLTAGLSGAVGLFAAMVLTSRVRELPKNLTFGARELAHRLNGRAWTLIALSAIIYRPFHGAALRWGWADDAAATALADLVAVAVANVGFILLLAARAFARGCAADEVRKRVLVLVTVMVAMTGATWLTR